MKRATRHAGKVRRFTMTASQAGTKAQRQATDAAGEVGDTGEK